MNCRTKLIKIKMNKFKLTHEHILAISLILIASISRLFPLLPNFQPIMGIALFAGSIFASNKKFAFAIPLLAMLISDTILSLFSLNLFGYYAGFHDTILFVYLSFALVVFLGIKFTKSDNILSVLIGSISGSIIFFIITNFAVWIFGIGIDGLPYTKSISGLMSCYIAAIPFFKNTLLSSVLYSFALFTSYNLASKYILKPILNRIDKH